MSADLKVHIGTKLLEEGWTNNPEVVDNILSCLKRCAFMVCEVINTVITDLCKCCKYVNVSNFDLWMLCHGHGNNNEYLHYPTATVRQEQPICLHSSTNIGAEKRIHVWSKTHAQTPHHLM